MANFLRESFNIPKYKEYSWLALKMTAHVISDLLFKIVYSENPPPGCPIKYTCIDSNSKIRHYVIQYFEPADKDEAFKDDLRFAFYVSIISGFLRSKTKKPVALPSAIFKTQEQHERLIAVTLLRKKMPMKLN